MLGTDDRRGLGSAEAEARLAQFGPNVLPHAPGPGPVARFMSQFNHPLIYVLLGAALVTGLLGETVDAGVILGVVLVNAVIGFIQESRADAALAALAQLTRTSARVIRDGETLNLASTQVVPGDLVVLEAGDKVPADLRLVTAHEMTADESMLTGESVPVGKACLTMPVSTAMADRVNIAYAGTLVIRGQAAGITVATAGATEIGRIQALVSAAPTIDTPLTRKLATFSRWLTLIILALAAVTFVLGLARGESAAYMVTAAVALAVGAIPEGLPAAVTITLAIGVSRMAKRNAIIRRMPAAEALGSTTVICTDKTGTLTMNQMTVATVIIGGVGVAPGQLADSPGPGLLACLQAGALCNNADLVVADGQLQPSGDPTETALLIAAHRVGIDLAETEARYPRLDELPFDSERRYMATLHHQPGHSSPQGNLLLVKGAAEQVLASCNQQLDSSGAPTPLDRAALLGQVDDLAGRALRVLAVARAEHPGNTISETGLTPGSLTLMGLVGMADPPRPEAITSVAKCQHAGIAVKMITGDHRQTGLAIATAVGLGRAGAPPTVLTGTELADCPPAELAEVIAGTDVFARVTAEQKLRIVAALQSSGQVVAMTGDGVNDAPALKQADIGVAMGLGGSEVAKESADMILTDDNFATIEAAVEEGRGVFDNLTKFITWTLPTNIGEGLVITAAIVANAVLPITPVQILWINMTTAIALGLMLAFEPGETNIMNRPPRDPAQPILTRELSMRILGVSAILLIGSFSLFHLSGNAGDSLAEARTVAVNAFVMVETAYLFNCRSLTRSAASVGWFSNKPLLAGVATMIGLQLLLTYAPFMHTLFETAPISVTAWAQIIALGLLTFAAVEAEKYFRRSDKPLRSD